MKLKIGGKEYELAFGMGFINALDNIYTQNLQGMAFGTGVESLITYLNMENPTSLYNGIKAATSHLKSKPSNEDLEAYITELAEKDELGKLYDDFFNALEKAPLVRKKIQTIKENMNEAQNEDQ